MTTECNTEHVGHEFIVNVEMLKLRDVVATVRSLGRKAFTYIGLSLAHSKMMR